MKVKTLSWRYEHLNCFLDFPPINTLKSHFTSLNQPLQLLTEKLDQKALSGLKKFQGFILEELEVLVEREETGMQEVCFVRIKSSPKDDYAFPAPFPISKYLWMCGLLAGWQTMKTSFYNETQTSPSLLMPWGALRW